MSRHSCVTSGPRPIGRRVAGAIGFASAVLLFAAPVLADGMPEPEVAPPAPKRHVVRHVHRYHSVRHETRPVIGYVIKHVHEDLGAVVYVQPAWPACRYVLDTALVRTVRDSYTGHFDCGS